MTNLNPEAQLEEAFSQTLALAGAQGELAPEQLVQRLDSIGRSIQELELSEARACELARSFAERRLRLIDDRSEYRVAGNEMLMLSMALLHHEEAASEVLKLTLLELSNDLSAPGAAVIFGRLLKRLQGLARKRRDTGLLFWVEAIASALPD